MTRQTKIKLKRYGIFALIILCAHLLQNSLMIFPEIAGIRPILLISVAICIAMYEGEVIGGIAGLFAGALWDTVTVTADGYNALYLAVACAICGFLLRVFMRNNIITYIMMNSAVTLLYCVTYVLFFIAARGIDSASEIFVRYYFPMAIYSLVFTPLWYLIIRGVSTKFANVYTEY